MVNMGRADLKVDEEEGAYEIPQLNSPTELTYTARGTLYADLFNLTLAPDFNSRVSFHKSFK